MPLISIITVNLNNKQGLEKTLQSVFCQTFSDYEQIIIDGGSVDGSQRVIDKYRDGISYSVSEKDAGIYAAMNKGIKASSGKWLLFLNSGDWLVDECVLSRFSDFFEDNIDMLYGDMQLYDSNNKKFTEKKYSTPLSFGYFQHFTLPHQATLIRSYLFDEIGLYTEKYQLVSDWAFFLLAICRYNKTAKHIDQVVVNFDLEGVGSKNIRLKEDERKDFLATNFPYFLAEYDDYYRIKNLKVVKIWTWFQSTNLYAILKRLSKRPQSRRKIVG